MKFLTAQISYFVSQREARRNLFAFARYLMVLAATVLVFAVLFHFVMLYFEGQEHSWITGVYWTLTVMSTLGFGDITFHSDVGRLFSIIVLLTGVVMLLIVLPFAFIRYFYGPWLEAQLHNRAPRRVPEDTEGHIVICSYETIAAGLVERLQAHDIQYFVIEADPNRAAALVSDGVSAVAGELDSAETYRNLNADKARLVFANLDDATNTNITITVREVTRETPVMAIVEDADSIDVLELAGSEYVVPLKHQLGEQLAARVSVGRLHANILGDYQDLVIAEFVVHDTPLSGKTLRESAIRQKTGLSVLACWERGKLKQARPDLLLTDQTVVVVLGTKEQVAALDDLYGSVEPNDSPVLIIGGGKVGRAAAQALKKRGIVVHVIERNQALLPKIEPVADKLVFGDANDRSVLAEAGLEQAPAVLVTTHDDSMNTYLAVYCRRLNPRLRIVSRVTHERNVEALHRAGADLVLSYSSLGANAVLTRLRGHDMVVLGEGIDLFVLPVPSVLARRTLVESGIRAKTGLTVVAVQQKGKLSTNPDPTKRLPARASLVVIGTAAQAKQFSQEFG